MKKQDYYKSNQVKHVDYKDVDILKKFLNQNARMLSRRKSGLTACNQREFAMAVKRARFMALLPYVAS